MAAPTRTNAGFVENWRIAGPLLEQVLDAELANIDVAAAMESLDDAYESAMLHHPPSLHSGLIEQQRCFMKGLAREKAAGCRS